MRLLKLSIGFLTIFLASSAFTEVANAAFSKNEVETKFPANRQLLAVDLPIFLGQNQVSSLEREIVEEMNQARANPSAYAAQLEALKQYYDGNLLSLPGQTPLQTEEGVEAVEEAIAFLREAKPLPSLNISTGMSQAARDLVTYQGPKGETGHVGEDGSQAWDRMGRYGEASGRQGENISYGKNTAAEVVLQLIIDDGVENRGHRDNIFNSDYQYTGVACGNHAQFNQMCVITYAGGYTDNLATTPGNVTIPEVSPSSGTPPISPPEVSPPVQTPPETAVGPLLQENGILQEGDDILPNDNSLYDVHTFQGSAGRQVTITVESDQFDTYLALIDPTGELIQESDDIAEDNTNSAITLTLPMDGVYRIIINSYDAQGRGEYQVTVR
ncbi:MAG: CAP domain-containing protein [Oscillatoria sp. PMC 1068.18]|nr:CAP domain-containing protein [Oscillatoria sp. PMC 1076.18]MEC4988502.1 CAP domain-containing protein [Oscillatoria sp. PMC 1068.18]